MIQHLGLAVAAHDGFTLLDATSYSAQALTSAGGRRKPDTTGRRRDLLWLAPKIRRWDPAVRGNATPGRRA